MAIPHIDHEKLRTIQIPFTFSGGAGQGANGVKLAIDKNPLPSIDENEFIWEVFYRVTSTLTSGDTAGTYLEAGFPVDDPDAILNSTTGILNTLNAGDLKPVHAYTRATVEREIELYPKGLDDITGGSIIIYLTLARFDEVYENNENSPIVTD